MFYVLCVFFLLFYGFELALLRVNKIHIYKYHKHHTENMVEEQQQKTH